jgi:hypothetical protein
MTWTLSWNGVEHRTDEGVPVAFIETAWRRYTKHSRNKAQEIQGAIEPLAETYSHSYPFKGAILAGVFTQGALEQLRSLGFTVLYFPYSSVIAAFRLVGIDAQFDENTPDSQFQQKVNQWERLTASQQKRVRNALLRSNQRGVNDFMESLRSSISRQIETIIILPLHGGTYEARSIHEAVQHLETYDETKAQSEFVRYEIQIRFNNGNEIAGRFNDKQSGIEFLRTYQSVT